MTCNVLFLLAFRDGSDEAGMSSGFEGMSCRIGINVCVLPYENEEMHEKLCRPGNVTYMDYSNELSGNRP